MLKLVARIFDTQTLLGLLAFFVSEGYIFLIFTVIEINTDIFIAI